MVDNYAPYIMVTVLTHRRKVMLETGLWIMERTSEHRNQCGSGDVGRPNGNGKVMTN